VSRLASTKTVVGVSCIPNLPWKALLLMLATSALALVGCATGHSESWQYGYERANSAEQILDSAASVRQACSMSMTFAALTDDHEPLDKEEVIAGCVQGVKDGSN
jgi:hypothetical protein